MQGIYYIRNTANGRVYVGSSQGIEKRWAAHRSALRYGRHINAALQADWSAHGEAAFEFVLAEEMTGNDAAAGVALSEAEAAHYDRLANPYNAVRPALRYLYGDDVARPAMTEAERAAEAAYMHALSVAIVGVDIPAIGEVLARAERADARLREIERRVMGEEYVALQPTPSEVLENEMGRVLSEENVMAIWREWLEPRVAVLEVANATTR